MLLSFFFSFFDDFKALGSTSESPMYALGISEVPGINEAPGICEVTCDDLNSDGNRAF